MLTSTAADLILAAAADGVQLYLEGTQQVKANGDPQALKRWVSTLRQHKPAILHALAQHATAPQAPCTDPHHTSQHWLVHTAQRVIELVCSDTPTLAQVQALYPQATQYQAGKVPTTKPNQPLSQAQTRALRAWLANIEETDPQVINHVLRQCQHDARARGEFLRMVGGG